MAHFYADSISVAYTNINEAKKWWTDVFECKQTEIPGDWEVASPSDVSMQLPGVEVPTIYLQDKTQSMQTDFVGKPERPILFTGNLKKAHEHLTKRGFAPGQIQEEGAMQFFNITDFEGNSIEVCLDT